MHHAAFSIAREPGGPEYHHPAVRSQALAVKDKLSGACCTHELTVHRDLGFLPEKQHIQVRQAQFGGLVLGIEDGDLFALQERGLQAALRQPRYQFSALGLLISDCCQSGRGPA